MFAKQLIQMINNKTVLYGYEIAGLIFMSLYMDFFPSNNWKYQALQFNKQYCRSDSPNKLQAERLYRFSWATNKGGKVLIVKRC